MSKGKEILQVVEAVSNEKGLQRETIFEAIEAALASAARRRHPEDIEVRVAIDRSTGDYEAFRRWEVISDDEEEAELESEDRQIRLADAHKHDPDLEVGDYIEEPMEPPEFGRIAAQAAKQVIVQRVRQAERAQVVEAFEERVGELVSGQIKRMEKGGIMLDLGENAEAFIPSRHTIPGETARINDRVRGYLYEVRPEVRGPQLFVSRTMNEFLIELFKLEVPEIGQDLIELKGAARDPGRRAKISVNALDERTDPIGACVGMRGSRVQAVSNELAGERIDIILWDENPAQFVINAMAPAEVHSIVVDEDTNSMDIAVEEENLSQAIGRGGQNVRLASELTGWNLNVMTIEEAEQKSESEATTLLEMFKIKLDVDEEVATILVQEGFTNIEEVAYVPESELLEVEEFDENIVAELRQRARDALLTQMIASEEQLEEHKPEQDLLDLEGMTDTIAYRLAEKGIRTRDDLAECAVDELEEIEELDPELAAELIMAARAHWFAEE
ncbi:MULTISPECIES: transcription termination factor NusA [unclassified Wenzhouxiangella]|uniref:transcription termination factor NusA n=1 Tax=unclassified Wenzhouxiangella TaxID=2613841 RepID=UPI000E32BA6A|nr:MULTISPECIES: transcription termination factor NusA [unclassified Wenzhouxiangella]RFF27581.1 transcription termination/antitermination protein NusA [Wenzhouxiangella sp. 15181]RFP70105.1 transcription termination/antitermination protein NusA [Wenzhouxiangella sp. 15190]